jgi:hypothetical protein
MRARVLLVALALASVTLSAADWPGEWEVRAEGLAGRLVLDVRPDGRASADLAGLRLEGFADGSRVVLRHADEEHAELWTGWWSPGRDGMPGFLAGTRITTRGKTEWTTGWYALEVGAPGPESAKAPPVAPPDPRDPASVPTAPPASLDPRPARVALPPAVPARTDLGEGPLAGRWHAAEGVYVMAQDGPRLRVTTPDGREVEGRQTADAALVIGLRLGCCRGELETPGVIRWQDGAVWRLDEHAID